MLAVSLPGVLFVVAITAACLGLISWLLAGSRVTVARRGAPTDPPLQLRPGTGLAPPLP